MKSTYDKSTIYILEDSIDYSEGGVVSKQILKNEAGNITLFSFDKGQGLSEHSAPYDAFVQVLDGDVEIKIASKTLNLRTGETIILPANVSHALSAVTPFKMLLTMIKG